jgi:hypothetical protein
MTCVNVFIVGESRLNFAAFLAIGLEVWNGAMQASRPSVAWPEGSRKGQHRDKRD